MITQEADAIDQEPQVMIPNELFDDPDYRHMSAYAVNMLIELARQAVHVPNGLLNIAHGTMDSRMRPGLLAVAQELTDTGWATWVRSTGTKRRPVTFWALAWLPYEPLEDDDE